MGDFEVTISIRHPDGGDTTAVSALVDTGATDTTIPASLLDHRNIERKEKVIYETARGERVEFWRGQALIGYNNRSWICPVVFGDEDVYLLGATTLEAFNLAVDPVNQELTPIVRRLRPV